jgi:hypothetical protein
MIYLAARVCCIKEKGTVEVKCRRLDIEVVVRKKSVATSTSISLPEFDLPSVEDALKMLTGALKRLGCA